MDRIIEILQEINPDVDYEINDTLIDDGILDSFDLVELVGALDEEFGITIKPVHMVPENFNSAELIYELMKKLKE